MLTIRMMGGFRAFVDQRELAVPGPSARVVAVLALAADRCVDREVLAATLWPETDTARSLANLRSALWRMPEPVRSEIERTGHRVQLDADVVVDVDRLDGGADHQVPVDAVAAPLLPDWYDDWALAERERFDQRRIAILEAIATDRYENGAFAESLDVALTALAIDPYRESVHRVVLRSLVAEGNHVEAVRHYTRLERHLIEVIGTRPDASTTELISGCVSYTARPAIYAVCPA